MARGKTRSPYSLGQRRAKAFDLFTTGATNVEVARELGVTEETAARYRTSFEDKLREQAASNPHLLSQTLENTLRALEENDRIRRELWNITNDPEIGNTNRISAMDKLLKAQEQRAKLFSLFGVKQEYMLYVQSVKLVQDQLLEFMRRELCSEDREKLERLLLSLEDTVAVTQRVPAIDVGAREVA